MAVPSGDIWEDWDPEDPIASSAAKKSALIYLLVFVGIIGWIALSNKACKSSNTPNIKEKAYTDTVYKVTDTLDTINMKTR